MKSVFSTKVIRAGILLLFIVPSLFAQTSRLKGTVRDTTGAVIARASVTLHSGAVVADTKTDDRGRFSFASISEASGTVTVQATGFTAITQSWNAASATAELQLILQPSRVNEQIVVSAARAGIRLSDAPGSNVLLSQRDVSSTPALTIDDMLRQVPGFSLFRRSGSRTSNPTSQGVSLRGLSASGSSRALVLEDGIPLLDPFGGWVQWDRIPRAELSDVEVFRGGASNLYGSDAMGGVVQFITREPHGPALSLETSFGNERTPDLSVWTGTTAGKWDFGIAADLFHTDGYILVPLGQRGVVDTAANSQHAALDFNVAHQLGSNGRVFLRGNLFDESRNNGTPAQTNDTHIGQGAVGLDKQIGSSDSLTARVYGDVQSYNQNFSSIASSRATESLTDIQHVPAQELGGATLWTHALNKSNTLLAGADLLEVIGASDEALFTSGTHTQNKVSGGRQRTLGLFGEDIFRIDQKWTIILGMRFDRWSNFDGNTVCTAFSRKCSPAISIFPDRTYTALSPRLSVLRSLTKNVSLTASGYRAFRAPTLNELYRSFRQGNTLTLSNPALRSEQLTGGEAGVNISGFNRKLELRSTFFWSDIVDPDENVTLTITPSLITRERQNLGRTRSRGVELDGVVRLTQDIQVSAGFDFTDATVINYTPNAQNASLLGLDVPQIPRHQFTWEARYWNPSRLLLSLQGRFVGTQYDDDQNTLPLDRFYAMDLMVGRSITHGMQAFAAVENLTNERYMVARTPVVNLGPPILFRIGLRYDYPRERK
ncbi:MAG: TonB-dependent receptor [Acidobacteriaceae bacterium]|nr:TonB-dependent receptor [Acidobacteriaceae bacterium]